MKTKTGWLLLLAMVGGVLIGFLAFGVGVAAAQDVTDEPTPTAESPTGESVPADDIVIEADEPGDTGAAFGLLVVLAGSVAGAVEMIKAGGFRELMKDANPNLYAFILQVIAIVLAGIALLAFNDPALNIFTALGIFEKAPPALAFIVTALAVSFGNQFLHNFSDFFRRPGTVRPASSQTADRNLYG